jgi:aminoglycoside phosphotransferase family enzyme
VELREKNISWVFLVGESAHKLKKPLVRDFLDDGPPERGRVMCEERNCASTAGWPPDVYLGICGVAISEARAELTAADDPRAVDFLVEMRRYEA